MFRCPLGFYFSSDENSALVQTEGGPCAVIAPVQAFIVKQLLAESDISTWHSIKPDKCNELLVKAMTEILAQAVDPTNVRYSILLTDKPNSLLNGEVPVQETQMDVESVLQDNLHSEGASNVLLQPAIDSKIFHSRLRYIIFSRLACI